ncbi:unnamed protein product, partial [Vitis vinifera]
MTELEDESYEDPSNGTNTHLKKGDAETLTGDSLKVLYPSKGNGKVNGVKEGPVKASEINKSVVKDSSNLEKEEALELASIVEASRTDKWNAKTSLVERVQKDKKAGRIITNGGGPKGESSYDLFKENCDIPEGKKDFNGGASGPPRKKFDQKAKSPLQDGMRIPLGKEQPASSCKKKSKGSQRKGTSALELTRESLRVDSSAAPEDMVAHRKYVPYKSNRDDIKSQKDLMKVKESQAHLIGKEKLEKKEIRMDPLETSVKEKNSSKLRVAMKETCASSDKLKERSGGKKSSCPSTFEAHQEVSKTSALTGNGSISGALPTEVAPVVIQENWVCCDKCHKWRLLPYGENPNCLPKKWLCSMLYWLPGMNRCSVSEEETTNALNALYQVPVPVPEVQTIQPVHTHGAASGATLADARNLGQNHQYHSFDAASSGGKTKHGTKPVSNVARHSSFMNLSNSSSDQLASTKRSLKHVDKSPLEFNTEERSGDAKLVKMKCKREADQDGFRVSKKIKTKGMHYIDGDQSRGRLEPEIDTQKHNEYSSSRDSKAVTKKLKNQVKKSVTMEEQNKRYVAGKKKKLMDWQDSQFSLETVPSNGHQSEAKWIVEKQNSGSEHGKGKKPRRSELERKESIASIPDGKPNRKGTVARILLSSRKDDPVDGNSSYEEGKSTEKDQPLAQSHGNNLSRQAIDCKTSSRRDLPFRQPPTAATSSSSKISSSCKVKVNSQEVKGSPVESVSSSPLRMSSRENFRTNLLGKDDATGADFFLMNNPRSCSEAEGDGENVVSGRARKEKAFSSNHQRSMKSSLFDYQDRITDHKTHGKVKVCTVHPSKLPNTQLVNSSIDNYEQDKERVNNLHFHNGSVPENFGKVFSSQAKEKHLTSKSGSNRGKIKASDSHKEQKELFLAKSVKYEMENEFNDNAPHKEEMRDMKFKIEGGYGIKSDKAEKNCVGKKVSAGKRASESCKIEKQTKFEEHDNLHGKSNTICQKDGGSTMQQNRKVEKSLKCLSADSTDQVEVASGKSDAAKAAKQHGESEGLNGIHVGSRDPTPNRHGARDIVAPNPVKQGTSIRAARNALKEAKNLKHLADRLKISGSGLESTELFFQAALKFLYGATLLELCNSEGVSCGEMSSIEVFNSTAKLCEYCAHEFERWKSMAFAALSYKCMEVAYMQVVYSTDSIASRDRNELQMALEMVLPVESPSSSASGVDNLNNQAAIDKMDIPKDASSQVMGNHVIAARNRPNFVRLLDFAQIVSFAMEASWKSQNAFAAANVVLAEAGNEEGISSVKRVLDFSFHDVDGFLRLVRLAMEALAPYFTNSTN